MTPRTSQVRRHSPRSVRRAALVALLCGALGLTAVSAPQGAPAAAAAGLFHDDDGGVHEPNIEAVAAAGITSGCRSDAFCPSDRVTRGQLARFLVRGLGLSGTDGTTFTDTLGSLFEQDIAVLAASGITTGCTATTFCPTRTVTRGEMALLLQRALELESPAGDTFGDDDGTIFEPAIEAIVAAGITAGCGASDYCPGSAVTRGQMATFLAKALGLDPLDPIPDGTPDAGDVTLVSQYHLDDPRDWRRSRVDVEDMHYLPRGFHQGTRLEDADRRLVEDVGDYAGWDVLVLSDDWAYQSLGRDDDMLRLRLERSARVAVVWLDESPLPSWLSSWDSGGVVRLDGDAHPVLETTLAAGRRSLGSMEYDGGRGHDPYLVLLAESDGTPTPHPPVPDGAAFPRAGEACPDWVHRLHTTVGPDGGTYNTWHPQLDPTFWCAFGHEHGSSPELIPGTPEVPYQYVATAGLEQIEPDMGFKEFTFQHDDGHWVRFVIHAGTASERRVCARFHTLYVQVYDTSGVEQMNVGFKADYGTAAATGDSGGGLLTPTTCGYSMEQVDREVNRRTRRLNIGPNSDNYETWDSRVATTTTSNLGMPSFEHSFDIRNPMSHCANRTCNNVVLRDPDEENSTRRTLGMARDDNPFRFRAGAAIATGEFYTDAFGLRLLDAEDEGAVRQYVAPGLDLEFRTSIGDRIECAARNPWTFDYHCVERGGPLDVDLKVPDMNIQSSLRMN